MIKFEEITKAPSFKNQLENKILYASHVNDISITYQSTYSLKYVIEGVKNYSYNHQDIEVAKNQYVILNDNTKITTAAQRGTKGLSFFLAPKLMHEIYSYHTNDGSPVEFIDVVQKESNSKLYYLLNKIAHLYEHNQINFKQQKEELFICVSELIVKQQVNLNKHFVALKIAKHNTKRALYQSVMAAKEYLDDNLNNSLSLDSISKEVGVSKYYLHRLFTEINGCTPIAYLTAIRLKKAKAKLQYSKESIFEIAMACGFDNAAYFSNTFKKHTGLSPTQFRRKL